jgi:Hemerythrin HHE cation binding domain
VNSDIGEPIGVVETRLVHEVHRAATSLLVEAAGSGETGPLTELRDFVVANLRHHHETEDHMLWPRLADRAPGAMARLESLSEEHDALDAGLDALAEAPVDGLAAAAAALRDLVHNHLEHEEPVLLPVLRDHMPDDEWAALSKEVIATTPPEGARLMIGFLDEVGTPEEVVAILTNLPAPAKPMIEVMRKQAHATLDALKGNPA